MKLAQHIAATVSACAALVILGAAVEDARGVNDAAIIGDGYPAKLSEFHLFTDIAARTPAPRVTSYTLNTPLFSDYAEKQRYLYVPGGKIAAYDPDKVIDLPVGSALVKTFGYQQSGKFKALETRLLLHRASGWVAIPYVWNADGTDAVLKRAGTRIPVTFTDPSGQSRTISYSVPNQNQCKDCHALSGAITPIGPKIRNLNDGKQLQALLKAGMIDRLPADAPRLARWDDAATPLADRARAYLETNCAHCHNPNGAASNSGLYLDWKQADANARGILKHPVAAGRGSGSNEFDIDPGHPERSILIFRMESTDPGIAMPELGRATVHAEAIALLTRWISDMPTDGNRTGVKATRN
ncbi:SO2930 family diheme c-type cytochrome [Sphingomonas sp. So64.6b]|uniref:SO2930 family diheme c-type cytochrome n=1 Tax=Sphingomonas sp. So64.6b TaxID=2997354 RepID=UPI001FCEDCEB|nr:SO2930 family diheme c-type cytochrome [Sphingomonas sp. So64.6b]